MEQTTNPLISPVTGPFRLLMGTSSIGLYMGKTTSVKPTSPPYYPFGTVLSPSGKPSDTMPAITIPQPLPTTPDWDLCQMGNGTLNAAYQIFGGGSNDLKVGTVSNGLAGSQYGMARYNCTMPRFLRDINGNLPAQAVVSFIADNQQLGLLIPATPDNKGNITAEFVSLTKASQGVVFGDLSKDMPTAVSLVYKTDRDTGPLSVGGQFMGGLSLATYDLGGKSLGTPVPLLAGTEIAEFDVASQDGVYCLVASTGDGGLVLSAFDGKGSPLGFSYQPLGPWNGVQCWIANPCIVSDPLSNTGNFKIAFAVFKGETPLGIYMDSILVSPKSGVIPPTPPAAAAA